MRSILVVLVLSVVMQAGNWLDRPAPSAIKPVEVHSEALRDRFLWTGHVRAGQTIEVRGINGDVRAEPSSNGRVEVVATKRSGEDDPGMAEIQVVEHRGGITVCAIFPGMDRDSSAPCEPGLSEGNPGGAGSAPIDFALRVPPGVRFVGRTVNGKVEARALTSDVEAYTVDGSIGVSTAGHAVAETVNGSIEATLGGTKWERPLQFKTVNGAIIVTLPANANADVRGRTNNGEIRSDFPLAVNGDLGPKRVAGTLGRGGPEMTLTTVNGTVQLRRRQDRHARMNAYHRGSLTGCSGMSYQ